ncbi:MAG TPA: transposase [Candidatus Binatia bacterium]|nr:transposase [Candidatus Binatia bacterium]
MKRKRYTQEFKQQVVQEAVEVGNAALVARRHELMPKQVYDWIKQSKHQDWKQTSPGAKKVAPYTPSLQEFRAVEEENDKLKRILGDKDLEIEILRDLVKKVDPTYRRR